MQNKLMKYDPVTGKPTPYPSQATQYRKYHGVIAWLYNPWTGDKRDPQDIGSDIQGVGIDTGEEEIARLYGRLYSYSFTPLDITMDSPTEEEDTPSGGITTTGETTVPKYYVGDTVSFLKRDVTKLKDTRVVGDVLGMEYRDDGWVYYVQGVVIPELHEVVEDNLLLEGVRVSTHTHHLPQSQTADTRLQEVYDQLIEIASAIEASRKPVTGAELDKIVNIPVR